MKHLNSLIPEGSIKLRVPDPKFNPTDRGRCGEDLQVLKGTCLPRVSIRNTLNRSPMPTTPGHWTQFSRTRTGWWLEMRRAVEAQHQPIDFSLRPDEQNRIPRVLHD